MLVRLVHLLRHNSKYYTNLLLIEGVPICRGAATIKELSREVDASPNMSNEQATLVVSMVRSHLSISCACKNSRCLKKYCVCFAAEVCSLLV